MTIQKQSKKDFFSSFFNFKNKETEEELTRVISLYEGIKIEDVEKYLILSHTTKKALLLNKITLILKQFWGDNPMPLTDLIGLTNLAMTEIKHNAIKRGEKRREKEKWNNIPT